MVTYLHQYKDRQSPAYGESSGEATHIVVIPSSEAYADQLEDLQYIGYEVDRDTEDFIITADMFRNHIRVFPEGQFMALEVETDRVVGMTSSMRIQYDPAQPILEGWFKTTGYG